MTGSLLHLIMLFLFCSLNALGADKLEQEFRNPPEETKPWCYWFFLDGDISEEGITKDLEKMKELGIQQAIIMHVRNGNPKPDYVRMMSPRWMELKRFALKEAARCGIAISLHNCPGWSSAGGPWIKPEQSMRRVSWNEFEAEGGAFSRKIRPAGIAASQDIAVLAVPRKDSVSIVGVKDPGDSIASELTASSSFPNYGVANAIDKNVKTRWISNSNAIGKGPTPDSPEYLNIKCSALFPASSFTITPYSDCGPKDCELQYSNDGEDYQPIISFTVDAKGEKTVVFEERKAKFFRLVIKSAYPYHRSEEKSRNVQISEIALKGKGVRLLPKGSFLRFVHTKPFVGRAMVVHGKGKGRLYALQDGQRKLVADISTGHANPATDFLPNGIETFSFKDVKAREFGLVGNFNCKVELTSEPKVAQVIEKQMGRMFPSPQPRWESYIFPDSVEPDNADLIINPDEIINLTAKLKEDGSIACELPPGKWTVIWFGMKPTGKTNVPASVEGTGLEVDKMSKTAIEYHFNSMVGKIISELTEQERSALKGVTIDSYEVGAQNWTDGFDKVFETRVGYDPVPWLPVLTGRVVGSAKASDMFLWNLRRQVADLISINYVGGLRRVGNRHGLRLWLENYGHWGYPGEFLMYGGYCDDVAGEFWSTVSLGDIECRAASSCAHIYGKRRVYAEAFTSHLNFGHHPYTFKRRGEEMFCEGINHFVLTVSIHQPRDGMPGKNPWYGTAFHRNTPWYNKSHSFIEYLQRIHLLLQLGDPVADAAIYIGDFAPQMTGPPNPIQAGYDFDYINSDVIMNRLHVVNGEWAVHDENDENRISSSYKVLGMPELKYIRPEVRKSLDRLIKQGGKISTSLPVKAAELQNMGVHPIVSDATCFMRYKQRKTPDMDIFFICNFANTGPFTATFRSRGGYPEIFDPVSGKSWKTPWFSDTPKGTRVTLNVKNKADSYFVIFHKKGQVPRSLVSAQKDGKGVLPDILDLRYDPQGRLIAETSGSGNYSIRLSDGTTNSLTVPSSIRPHAFTGPWKIEFGPENSNLKAPFSLNTDELLSWNKLPDAKAQKFTGTAVYKKTFTPPAELLEKNRRVYLDLGNVNVMAGVTLNNKTYDTLWVPPFRIDITDQLKRGENKLSIEVTSRCPGCNPGLLGPVQLLRTRAEVISKKKNS